MATVCRVPRPACQRFDRAAGFATIDRAATIGSGDRSTVANIEHAAPPEASAPVSGQAITPEANAATIERRAACLSGNRSTVRRLSIRRTSNAPQPFRKIKTEI